MGVVATTALFSFVEPGFPTEAGSLQYLIGMFLGFTVVSTVFFLTWRIVLHRLEPESEGKWKIFPPYILLAAFLVVMARLAHFLPGVVLGTVAEYEPAKELSVRTAGMRVAFTYGALMRPRLGPGSPGSRWSTPPPKEGASNLTLILDSALAITFVTALESIAFGLIPMKFLDGQDLFRWKKGIWSAMWGASLLWFALVVLNPALGTYGHHSESSVWIIAILFSSLMIVALSTWAFFTVRSARTRASRGPSTAAPVTARRGLPGRHAEGAVQPDRLSVEHRVPDDLAGELAVLLGSAEPGGERDAGAERLALLLR